MWLQLRLKDIARGAMLHIDEKTGEAPSFVHMKADRSLQSMSSCGTIRRQVLLGAHSPRLTPAFPDNAATPHPLVYHLLEAWLQVQAWQRWSFQSSCRRPSIDWNPESMGALTARTSGKWQLQWDHWSVRLSSSCSLAALPTGQDKLLARDQDLASSTGCMTARTL